MGNKANITDNLRGVWFLMGQRRARGMGQRRGGFDASKGRGRIIALLQLKDGLSTKEISRILDIRVSSTNEVLAKMEDAGLIERKPSEADRRIMLAYLTDEGREVKFEEVDEFDPYEGFSDEELDQLEGYSARMLKNAEAAFDPEFIEQMKERRAQNAEFFDNLDGRAPRPNFGGFGGPGGLGRMGCPHPGHDEWRDDSRHGHGHGPDEGRHGQCGHGPEGSHHGPGRGFADGPIDRENVDPRFFDARFFDDRF